MMETLLAFVTDWFRAAFQPFANLLNAWKTQFSLILMMPQASERKPIRGSRTF